MQRLWHMKNTPGSFLVHRINVSIIRPLVDRLYDPDDISIVYCLLVNRVQYLREQSYHVHQQSVSSTRALVCELLAVKILRRFDEENAGRKGLLLLAKILVAGFDPFQNAPDDVVQEHSQALHWTVQKRGGYERKLPALEVAIISRSRLFLSSAACQKVVDAIYKGRVVYTPSSFVDILPDHYKHKPISLYDPRKAPLLDQYRLIVPRTRNILEVCQFVLLLVFYILVMAHRDPHRFTLFELVFSVYALGWTLDQFASILEHGWQVYTQNLWSFLDVTFAAIYAVYMILRLRGLACNDDDSSRLAFEALSMGAPVLIPRLAFNLMSENMLFISMRDMMADFTVLTLLAVWCFAGFLLAMTWLSNGLHEPVTISKWMLWVWFGLDGTGIQRSIEFHWLLGPILMVTFAFLGNTLFLTILVSMLSNTFANIASNATAEIQFRRAVLTLEGVKSDAIFAYQPPFNILALFVLLPLKFMISPRWFHKTNVFAVRTLNAPLLLIISAYERYSLWSVVWGRERQVAGPAGSLSFKAFSRFTVHGDIQEVFDCEPPQSVLEEISKSMGLKRSSSTEGSSTTTLRRRGGSARGHNALLSMQQSAIYDARPKFGAKSTDCSDHIATNNRLEALENSTKKIEDLLLKIYNTLDDNSSDRGADAEEVLRDRYDGDEEGDGSE
ncbi:MAG: hypothetical protein M1825_003136 [Sarcosagium campestre]|nr:MAG: hypothetical protein M1825_003136 [Sarcosagium campestre]